MTAEAFRSELAGQAPETVLRRAWEIFGERLVFATSLAAEDQVITEMCERLLQDGAPGLHFYSMNLAGPSLAIWNNLKLSR